MVELRLTLLGRFEARLSCGASVDLPGQKDRALLAYLALGPGERHTREKLANLLWGDAGERQARNSLKQALLSMRRALRGAGRDVILADRTSIGVDRSIVHVDARSFMEQTGAETAEALGSAVALYRGDLLDGLVLRAPSFEDWLLIERQRLRQAYERALAMLLARTQAAGDTERSERAARQLLASDPLNETAGRALMQLAASAGQPALAIRHYESLRDRLREQLDVDPEPETQALAERIRTRKLAPEMRHNSDAVSVAGETAQHKPSIAVLPFLNAGDDPEQQYFSDGISEDIITALSRFHSFFVIARNSSFRYRGSDADVTAIGRELGVRYLAQGSIRRIGGRIRISAQLVDAQLGHHLWADHYDRDAAEILVVQDEIVRAIATTLGYQLAAASRERALRLSPEALTAHDLVLRSDAFHLRFTRESNLESRRLAERAVALDPASAVAHVQLGWTYAMDHLFSWVDDRGAALDKAAALARHAVMLDQRDAKALTLLGFALLYRRDFDEARAHLRAAISFNINDEEAHAIYGVLLTAVGESATAIEELDIARRHNPFEYNWVTVCRGIAQFSARRYDEAIATLIQIPQLTSEVRFWLAASYAGAGRLNDARAMMSAFLDESSRDMAAFPGRSLDSWRPYFRSYMEYRDEADFDHLIDRLRQAGLT